MIFATFARFGIDLANTRWSLRKIELMFDGLSELNRREGEAIERARRDKEMRG